MPIYEYQCQACGEGLEKLQKLSDEPLKLCPMCGKEELQKLVSAVGFQLKGTGWYATDFRDKGKKPVEDKPTIDDSKSSTTESTKETPKTTEPPKATASE